MKQKVLLTCENMLTLRCLDWLNKIFNLVVASCSLSEDVLTENFSDVSGYILGGLEKVTLKALEAAKFLKWIIFLGTQWETFIPEEEAKKYIADHNIKLYAMPGVNADAVAQRTIFEILTFKFKEDLKKLAISVIGTGNIGQLVVKGIAGKCREVRYHSRKNIEELDMLGAILEPNLEDAFKADIVTLHWAVIPGVTEGKITFEHLRNIKPGGLLINNAREGLIRSPKDLKIFLKDHLDVKVIFDVFWAEGEAYDRLSEDNNPDGLYEIKNMPNFEFTGHTAGIVPEAFSRELIRILENDMLF